MKIDMNRLFNLFFLVIKEDGIKSANVARSNCGFADNITKNNIIGI
jgi:transposase